MTASPIYSAFLPDPAGFLPHRDLWINETSLISEFDILFKALHHIIFVNEKPLFTPHPWKK